MPLKVPENGLHLGAGKDSTLPPQAFAVQLSDNVIENMIKCVQDGGDLSLDLGSDPVSKITGRPRSPWHVCSLALGPHVHQSSCSSITDNRSARPSAMVPSPTASPLLEIPPPSTSTSRNHSKAPALPSGSPTRVPCSGSWHRQQRAGPSRSQPRLTRARNNRPAKAPRRRASTLTWRR